MLTLQRASAGSGKTYTLTKTYLTLLISIADERSGLRRLRTDRELEDSVQHILAVTFTNKATNEMKERIIAKLYALAYPPADGKRPDYMADFTEAFHAPEQEISRVCREALHQVLYEYSDFNISTIDAFFQNILRTFAYESELPDSYQVVIDDKYLGRLATNTLLDDVLDGTADDEERYWVKRLVDTYNAKGSTHWNIHQRREGGGYSGGAFKTLIGMAASLDKFELEDVRVALDRFAESGQSLRHSDAKIREMVGNRAADLFAPFVDLAKRVSEEYGAYGELEQLVPSAKTNAKSLRAVTSPDADPMGDYKMTAGKSHLAGASKLPDKSLTKSMAHLKDLWFEMLDAYAAWKEYMESDDVRYWRLMEASLPDVALTASLRRRMADYLVENDAMKIADTNNMIRRIIADDDVPFIYERLGTRLNHFLIDEFQDTSEMQWENFSPLLMESESHDHDNLIIGDAKQSIYRFRNAEPKLITEKVPTEFQGRHIPRGFTVDENANWRSRPNVVKFNNFFFRALSDALGGKMPDLYTNTVQLPKKKGEGEDGYVEVTYFPKDTLEPTLDGEEEQDGDDKNTKVPQAFINRMGELITDMLRRGYRQKEIAVLVNSREGGKQVIAGLMEYDRKHRVEEPERLEFVSEESLTLDSSGAVNTVIESFRMIQQNVEKGRSSVKLPPTDEEERERREEGEESGVEAPRKQESINWVDIQNSFRIFSAKNPGKDLTTRLQEFLAGDKESPLLEKTIADMQAVTLPSLVEELTKVFVGEESRRREAPFLAALQDAVLDYCEANPTDIGSMLRWWDGGGKNISISSPEDTDAINVMTIHKSKGLEFECVILPDIDVNFGVTRGTTLWVPVPSTLSYAPLLPGMLPVKLTKKAVEGTEWEGQYNEENFMTQMDSLNKVYVAMTRAVSELYLLMKEPSSKAPLAMRSRSHAICAAADDEIANMEVDPLRLPPAKEGEPAPRRPDNSEVIPQAGDITASEDNMVFRYGSPLKDASAALAADRKKKERSVDAETIKEYFVNPDRKILKFQPEHTPYIFDEADDDRVDPRSEGSLKHAVLEMVEVEADLHHALARLRGRGVITRRVMREYEPELRAALESVRPYGWFDGSWRVLNERSMLYKKGPVKRPDRVMVSAENDVVVVDYKFGDVPKEKLYGDQVAQYMGYLEEMHQFRSVKGYIWYVKLGKVVEVKESISFAESYRRWQQEMRKKQLEREAEEALKKGENGR